MKTKKTLRITGLIQLAYCLILLLDMGLLAYYANTRIPVPEGTVWHAVLDHFGGIAMLLWLAPAALVCLALTWLNPHVYLDTMLLIGSVGTQYPGAQGSFAAGAICTSFLFFFALGYGARLFAPVFRRPSAWRVLHALIAVLMTVIAIGLLRGG